MSFTQPRSSDSFQCNAQPTSVVVSLDEEPERRIEVVVRRHEGEPRVVRTSDVVGIPTRVFVVEQGLNLLAVGGRIRPHGHSLRPRRLCEVVLERLPHPENLPVEHEAGALRECRQHDVVGRHGDRQIPEAAFSGTLDHLGEQCFARGCVARDDGCFLRAVQSCVADHSAVSYHDPANVVPRQGPALPDVSGLASGPLSAATASTSSWVAPRSSLTIRTVAACGARTPVGRRRVARSHNIGISLASDADRSGVRG